MIIKALTIAGSDPSGGAGVQSDLITFSNLRVYGVSVITCITSQNTQRITSIYPLSSELVKSQLDAIYEDVDKINAIKIGMVYDKGIIDMLYEYLKSNDKPLVIDPVLRATTGTYLLKQDAYDSFKKLLRLAHVITPNIHEASVLSGINIQTIEDAKEAAKKLGQDGVSVIITGGHFKDKAIDLLYNNNEYHLITNDKLDLNLHGAGNVFSAALTAELAKGFDILYAFRLANRYTRYALESVYKIGKGLNIPSLMYCVDEDVVELQRAIDIIESMQDFALLIPETQTNIAYAKGKDIFGIKGRMVRFGNRVKAGDIARNVSKHVANALIIAMKYSDFRCAINVKYDELVIKIAERLGMKVGYYDRSEEPSHIKEVEGMSITWGIEEVFKERLVDLVYHKGDLGKEPMIIIFGKDPMDLVNRLRSILDIYSAERSQ